LPASYRDIHLIYNPAAGKLQRGSIDVIHRAAEVLRNLGNGVNLVPTSGPKEARTLARRAVAGGADLVLVAGGDGTINEAMNGVVLSNTPMGVLPLGTANVLATELGLARSTEEVAALVPGLVQERISVGFLQTAEGQSRYFAMMAGIGLDAHIVVNVDLELKKKLGKLAYWIGGFAQLGQKFPEFQVTIRAFPRAAASPLRPGSATTAATSRSPSRPACSTTISKSWPSRERTPSSI